MKERCHIRSVPRGRFLECSGYETDWTDHRRATAARHQDPLGLMVRVTTLTWPSDIHCGLMRNVDSTQLNPKRFRALDEVAVRGEAPCYRRRLDAHREPNRDPAPIVNAATNVALG
jgi:hypothetical protein